MACLGLPTELIPTDPPADSHPPAVESVVDAIGRYVADLTLIGPDHSPGWLAALPSPTGWQIGRAENSPVQPTRTAVHRHDPFAGWDACETISVFEFTGEPPEEVVRHNADCTLRTLGADDIIVSTPIASLIPGVTAVRCSGHITLGDQQRVWAQFSTYMSGGTKGLLVEHGIFVKIDHQATLTEDIAQLSNTVQGAFLTSIDRR
ncbi:MAG: hypothetical protein F6Q13_16350 [Mycobacterium sp.]|nr:MAG: hypothetical protein F6Q13_16350 [Mycobacterium sp.]